MAAWGAKPAAAWATQVEEEEEQAAQDAKAAAAAPVPVPFAAEKAFPSLGDAVKIKETKKDKKKKTTVSLADFNAGKFVPRAAKPADDRDILAQLPTAPRTRDDADDKSGGLGGAFKDYGGFRGGGGGFDRDDEVHPGRREREEDLGPSKADESRNWGADKSFAPSTDSSRGGGGGFRERPGFGDRDREGGSREYEPSRADTADNWGGGGKRFEAPASGDGFRGAARYGERDRPERPERDDLGPSRADDEDRWSKKFVPSADAPRSGSGGGFGERAAGSGFGGGGFADKEDRWMRRQEASDSAPERAPAGERPRIKLAPRTLPAPELPKAAPPQAGRASSPAPEPAARPPGPRADPFGAARPREEVLREQGRDWKKEELALAHKGVDRKETDEEHQLRCVIEELQGLVAAGQGEQAAPAHVAKAPAPAQQEGSAAEASGDSEAAPASGEQAGGADSMTVAQLLEAREEELLKLTARLDDELRFRRGKAAAW